MEIIAKGIKSKMKIDTLKIKVIDHLSNIINCVDSKANENDFSFLSLQTNHGEIFLTGEKLDKYKEVCGLIQSWSNWDTKFSNKYIQKGVQKLISSADLNSSKVDANLVNTYLDSLNSYEKIQKIYVPISGITFPEETSLTLGNITFQNNTENTKKEISNLVLDSVKGTLNTAEEKNTIINILNKRLESSLFTHPAFAVCEIRAEPIRANQRAIEETGHSLNLIRGFLPFLGIPNWENVGIGIPGQEFMTPRTIITNLVLSEDGSLYNDHRLAGAFIPCHLTQEKLNRLEKLGALTLSEILKKDKLSDLEKRILSAVEWCSKTQVQDSKEFRILCLITSLECLLNPRHRPLKMGISEGVALLLSETTLQEKRKIRTFVAKMYDYRCSISHGGHSKATEQDIIDLWTLTGRTIRKILELRKEFTSQSKLINHLDDLRLLTN